MEIVLLFFFMVFLVAGARIMLLEPQRHEPHTYITSAQRNIDGCWRGQKGGQQIYLELKLLGQTVDGSILQLDGDAVFSGTFFAPDLDFDCTNSIGCSYRYTGQVSDDGLKITGKCSDFGVTVPFSVERIKVRAHLPQLVVYDAFCKTLFALIPAKIPTAIETAVHAEAKVEVPAYAVEIPAVSKPSEDMVVAVLCPKCHKAMDQTFSFCLYCGYAPKA